MRRPFFWKQRKGWYIKSGARGNVFLSDDRDEAHRMWAESIAAENSRGSEAIVAAVCNEFIGLSDTGSPKYRAEQSYYLADFCSELGNRRVGELKPIDVTKWLAGHEGWGNSSKRAAIAALKRALNWAVTQGLIDNHKLNALTKPTANRREVLITDADHARMMRSTDEGRKPGERIVKLKRRAVRRDTCFRPVLIAFRHTGSRSGSVAKVRIEDISPDGDAWILNEHKNKKRTGQGME